FADRMAGHALLEGLLARRNVLGACGADTGQRGQCQRGQADSNFHCFLSLEASGHALCPWGRRPIRLRHFLPALCVARQTLLVSRPTKDLPGERTMSVRMPEPDQAVLARRARIVATLRQLVPGEGVIATEREMRPFESDGLTAYRQLPMVVVLPETTRQVSEVLKYCHQEGIKVVPRGAGTSLSGGALPLADGVLLGMAKFNKIRDIDFDNRVAVVEPGVTNLGISIAVANEGFYYAPDPSSQIACTIGGNIAENSGGVHCLKYGMTTNNVLGCEIVLMDGEILRLGGKHLDSPGYDLLGLVTGSEGLLGVVTEVTVRILKKPETARA